MPSAKEEIAHQVASLPDDLSYSDACRELFHRLMLKLSLDASRSQTTPKQTNDQVREQLVSWLDK